MGDKTINIISGLLTVIAIVVVAVVVSASKSKSDISTTGSESAEQQAVETEAESTTTTTAVTTIRTTTTTDAASKEDKKGNYALYPDDALEFNGHKYYFYEIGLTWEEAEYYCVNLGGHFVSINSQEEQNFVEAMTENSDKKNIWIGGYVTESDLNTWR